MPNLYFFSVRLVYRTPGCWCFSLKYISLLVCKLNIKVVKLQSEKGFIKTFQRTAKLLKALKTLQILIIYLWKIRLYNKLWVLSIRLPNSSYNVQIRMIDYSVKTCFERSFYFRKKVSLQLIIVKNKALKPLRASCSFTLKPLGVFLILMFIPLG